MFGKIIAGTNVLNRFNVTNPTNGVFRTNLSDLLHPSPVRDQLNHLPVLPLKTGGFELVYVDVTLLEVRVSATPAGREISWNSVRGLTNRVEFTTEFPPVWTTLVSTNGSGERMLVSDPNSAAQQRFYRVRVDY